MTIEKLLEMVDMLAPNNCSEQQKLYWYNQCESIIFTKALKRFKYIETEMTAGIIKLPDGYCSEDIEAVYLNGKPADKLDFTSGPVKKILKEKVKVGIVLKEHHNEIIKTTYNGDIFFDGEKVTMPGNEFEVGDKIEIESDVFSGRVTVLGKSGDDLFVNKIFDINDCEGSAQRTLDIEVHLKPPYDKLYIDYILAQMDYYNKDYEGYNNNSYMFNEQLAELEKQSTSKAPELKFSKMHGLW